MQEKKLKIVEKEHPKARDSRARVRPAWRVSPAGLLPSSLVEDR